MTNNILKEQKFFDKGYIVIKKFLNEKDIEYLIKEYNFLKKDRILKKDSDVLYKVTDEIIEHLKPKIKKILEMVNDVSVDKRLKVDLITPHIMFASTDIVNFEWHQDHESYWILQQHKDYLNFYMILEKEYENKSGLTLVPLDVVEEKFPENLKNRFINSGAKTIEVIGEKTMIIDDQNGEEFYLDFDINNCAISPQLAAGDLLLFRGDTIHRTQDTDSKRTALSIRCTRSDAEITLEHLMQTSEIKSREMLQRKEEYFSLYERLKEKGKITAKDYFSNPKYYIQF